MKRQEGHYWVKIDADSDWEIAYYFPNSHEWQLIGIDREYESTDFYKIDERKIERNE